MADERQQDAAEFERNRAQLMNISSQKQQLQFQSRVLGDSLAELEKTGEKKVYKAVGNILILTPVDKAKKEVKDSKESVDLKVKTLQKQEELTIDKLNKLKKKLEVKEETPAKAK